MDFRILLVITPIIFAWIFTVFWLGKWDVFRLTPFGLPKQGLAPFKNCLLYTSDAADEEDSVDLGGRRIIKKSWEHICMP